MKKQIEVFRSGQHLAANGKRYSFTPDDVAGIAAAYDRQLAAAPAVLGHPKTDDPAWAWSEGFTVNDAGVLVVDLADIDPAFAEGVEAGRYRYTSLALYEPADPRNPKPGCWYPRHVGFLGAQPPAVKGLAPAFAEDEAADVVEFSADLQVGWSLRQAGSAFRGLRDWIIGKFGQEEADKALPAWTDQQLTDTATQVIDEARDNGLAGDIVYAEATAPIIDPTAELAARAAELEAREARLAGREAELAARDAQFAEAAMAAGRGEDLAFVDGLVEAGRLPPARRDAVLASLAHARGDAGGPAFAEGEDAHATLRGLLDGLGVTIQFSEFAAPDGFTGQVDTAALADKARELVAAASSRGETLSYADAVTRARSA